MSIIQDILIDEVTMIEFLNYIEELPPHRLQHPSHACCNVNESRESFFYCFFFIGYLLREQLLQLL